jgi:hypothetical protein
MYFPLWYVVPRQIWQPWARSERCRRAAASKSLFFNDEFISFFIGGTMTIVAFDRSRGS